MSLLKNIFKDTIVYSFISFFEKFLNYLLLPYLARFICSSDIGIISKIYTYIGILLIVFNYGLESAFFRFGKEKIKQIKTLLFYSTIILAGLTFFCLRNINSLHNYALYITLILVIDTFTMAPFAELKNDRNIKKYSLLKFSQTTLNVFLTILFIKYLRLEVIKFYLLANIFSNLSILFFLKPFSFVKLGKNEVVTLLSFALPLMCMDLIGEVNNRWTILSLDFFLPENFYDVGKNSIIGMVGMNCKIVMAINLGIKAFRVALNSMIFKKENDDVKVNQDVMHYFVVVMSFVWLAFSLNRELIARCFFQDEIYRKGTIIIPFMAFYHICNGIYFNISIYFKKTNQTIYNFLFSLVALVFNVLLSIVLIPRIGFLGSVISNLFSILVSIALAYWKNGIRYDKRDVLWFVVPMILVVLSHYFVKNFLLNIFITVFYLWGMLAFLLKVDDNLKEWIKSIGF